ncbi:hypothetical protein QU481_15005 [Crenobacter sp. SG2303]|uniref:ESPR domain-containing protein n=1 Tax=Crenobacter oryzisoli TaxID=3056844 RepID=A0ABT7XR64_9NEIS|nr:MULTISPECIES: hypothetical protein [unclassified Crenobacter]MDN0076193.1 hypothetical protein [Crenobacter sp. SG2303]MDN0084804.1 hypothetical protein [Crenobacter sp. SG2305]
MTRFYNPLLAGLLGVVALIGTAQAQDQLSQATAVGPSSALFSALPKAANLDAQTGQKDITLINNTSSATMGGQVGSTTISDAMVNTGSALIGAGAFNGMSGIGTVIQNTGNNVLIQDQTIFNVTMH